jgi:hypothetical protein
MYANAKKPLIRSLVLAVFVVCATGNASAYVSDVYVKCLCAWQSKWTHTDFEFDSKI